jgi:hypothetical protein
VTSVLSEATLTHDEEQAASTDGRYLAFRAAVLEPLRLWQGLRVRSYDMSLVVEALAAGARMLAPDGDSAELSP